MSGVNLGADGIASYLRLVKELARELTERLREEARTRHSRAPGDERMATVSDRRVTPAGS